MDSRRGVSGTELPVKKAERIVRMKLEPVRGTKGKVRILAPRPSTKMRKVRKETQKVSRQPLRPREERACRGMWTLEVSRSKRTSRDSLWRRSRRSDERMLRGVNC